VRKPMKLMLCSLLSLVMFVTPVMKAHSLALTLGIGLAIKSAPAWVPLVGKYLFSATSVAGLAYGSAHLTHASGAMDEISAFAERLWQDAPRHIEEALAEKILLAQLAGDNVVNLTEEVWQWFVEATASSLLELAPRHASEEHFFELSRLFDGYFTSPCTNTGMFVSCGVTLGNPSNPTDLGIWATLNGQFQFMTGFDHNAESALRINLVFDRQNQNVVVMRHTNHAHFNVIQMPPASSVVGWQNMSHSTASFREAMARGFYFSLSLEYFPQVGELLPLNWAIPAIESVSGLRYALNNESMRDRIETFPLDVTNAINSVREKSGGGIAIPLEDAIPHHNGIPLNVDRELGLMFPSGIPLTDEQQREVAWPGLGFPAIEDGGWTTADRVTDTVPPGVISPPVTATPELAGILGFLQSILNGILAIPGGIIQGLTNIWNAVLAIPGSIAGGIANVFDWLQSFFFINELELDGLLDLDLDVPTEVLPELPWLSPLLERGRDFLFDVFNIYQFVLDFISGISNYFGNAMALNGRNTQSHNLPENVSWDIPLVGTLDLPFMNPYFLEVMRHTWRNRIGSMFIILTGLALVRKFASFLNSVKI